MKITMYGTEICSDCVEAKEILKNATNITVDYKNITESTTNLKEFLTYRDKDIVFDEVKEKGKIGIPFFILEDGTKAFDIKPYVEMLNKEVKIDKTSCSIDGKGC